MGVKIGRGLRRSTEAKPVDEVLRNHRVHRTYIHLTGMFGVYRCFHKVFDKGFTHEQHRLKTLDALQTLDEERHFVLRCCQVFRTMLLPKLLVLHHSVGGSYLIALEAEGFVRYLREIVIAIFGGAAHLELLYELGQAQLHYHVVLYQHLLTGRKLVVDLRDIHSFHEVDACAHRHTHLHALHTVGGVGHDVQIARETEVLRIVGRERNVYTLLTFHL